MASTYHALANIAGNCECAFAVGKSMLSLWNGAATNDVRVYRMWALQCQTAAGGSALATMNIRRLTAAAVGTGTDVTANVIRHDTASPALPANVKAYVAGTVTPSTIFRQFYISTAVFAANTTVEIFQTYVSTAEIWNAGYGDSNVQPIRVGVIGGANEGVDLACTALAVVAGSVSVEFEFTVV